MLVKTNETGCSFVALFFLHFPSLRTDSFLDNIAPWHISVLKSLFLRTTVPFVTAHLEIFHCTHHPVIPKSDLYFTFCSTLNALSKRTSK